MSNDTYQEKIGYAMRWINATHGTELKSLEETERFMIKNGFRFPI